MECPHLSKGDIFDLKELEAKLKNGLVCSGKNMQNNIHFLFPNHDRVEFNMAVLVFLKTSLT